jgi:hypothetical protein
LLPVFIIVLFAVNGDAMLPTAPSRWRSFGDTCEGRVKSPTFRRRSLLLLLLLLLLPLRHLGVEVVAVVAVGVVVVVGT